MNVIYMGSPEFSVFGLEALIGSHHNVVAAVSREDKIKGRKRQLQPTAVKKKCLELGIPVLTPKDINSKEFLEEIRQFNADVIVVSAFGRILKKDILNLFPYGVINIHGSLLPAYRGASPMNAVLHDGCSETGITIMYMNEGMDEGDILKEEAIPIGENETFDSLMPRMGKLGGKLITECLDLLAENRAPRIKQKDAEATYCELLTRDDERIDWNFPGLDIHNQVRSLSSEPGAYTYYCGTVFKIIETNFEMVPENDSSEFGHILFSDKKKGVAVAVKDGILFLRKVKPQGKNIMSANDWFRGQKNDLEMMYFSND